jgi:prepilin-type N-terminal cleavage/methylation domain-containing protein
MTNVMKNEKGFTLLEIIVVLAVLGALAAMLSPVVFRYIDDANRARAQADVTTLATAIQRMYADTGRWAFYKDGDGAVAYTSSTDASYLTSDPNCDLVGDADLAACAGEPTAGTGWTYTRKADSLTRQLITNADLGSTNDEPYVTTGPRAWKGPYVDAIPSVDPWGQAYLVNIGGAAAANNYAVVAISAGPDGIIQTPGDTAATGNLVVTGDDIIARVK